MTDIVERLRKAAEEDRDRLGDLWICDKAADEIVRLREERDRLRDALTFYADQSDYVAPYTGGMGKLWRDCGGVARTALKGDTP